METQCEGVASFPSRPQSSFGYKVLRDSDRSDALAIGDLPSLKIAGEDATLDNYAAIFQSGLETTAVPTGGSSECQCDLVDADDGRLRLELTLALSVFSVVWNKQTGVELKPVELAPIAYAEAKIRDLEEQLGAIAADRERQIAAEENRRELLLEYASANCTIQNGGLLLWKRSAVDVRSKHFAVQPNGCVVVQTGGCYVVSLVVHHSSQKSFGGHFEVRWGKIRDQFTVASASNTSLLSKIVYLEERAVVRVVSRVVTGIVKGTTLTILPLVYR